MPTNICPVPCERQSEQIFVRIRSSFLFKIYVNTSFKAIYYLLGQLSFITSENMNLSNRNNFVFVFTTILLLTIFGVEMLNMALLVLLKSQAKTNCKQVPEQCPSNVPAMSQQCPNKFVLCRIDLSGNYVTSAWKWGWGAQAYANTRLLGPLSLTSMQL